MATGDNFSRRGLLACGAVSLAAAPFLSSARAEPAPGENRTARIQDAANLLTVAVMIAGAGPYRFVVDTGADRTVIAEDVAARLRLPLGARASVVGIARTVDADTVRVSRLDIGDLTTEELDVPVLPRAWLGADGYLGLDVLDRHRVTFDFRNGSLTLGAPHALHLTDPARPDESVLRAGGWHGRLRSVDCLADGVHAVAFLDWARTFRWAIRGCSRR